MLRSVYIVGFNSCGQCFVELSSLTSPVLRIGDRISREVSTRMSLDNKEEYTARDFLETLNKITLKVNISRSYC